jgi:hypothetical protein
MGTMDKPKHDALYRITEELHLGASRLYVAYEFSAALTQWHMEIVAERKCEAAFKA